LTELQLAVVHGVEVGRRSIQTSNNFGGILATFVEKIFGDEGL
jgi:hypothetical protein